MRRPRILIITRNLPPLVGGMEKLNWHMAEELAKKADVTIIGPAGASATKPKAVELHEVPLKPLPVFLLLSFLKGLWISLRWNPDIILAGSGLTAPLSWLIGKGTKAKSAAYLHGFDITVNNKLYRKLWRPSFRHLDRIIVNSSPTKQLAVDAGIDIKKIGTVYPGVKLPQTPRNEEKIQKFREENNLNDKKVLLSVGRLTTRKGLQEFVEQALPAIVEAIPEAVLVIIGETPRNSLAAGIQTVESIANTAKGLGLAEHIQFHGVITDSAKLSAVYEAADLHVFPVRHIPDDPEGFGMVAIEAAAHGLPTVAFSTGGVVDAVNDGISGRLIQPDDYLEFSQSVIQLIKSPLPQDEIFRFAKKFEWLNFGNSVFQNLTPIMNEASRGRKPHAVTDLASRIPKAKKIEKLLELDTARHDSPPKLLEIGCGSGGITHYFAKNAAQLFDVTGVDIHDNRQVKEGYHFIKTSGVVLPFPDNSFDVVITNHVIEHVGEKDAQVEHLSEIARVLKPGGQGYLAVPNRWMITEPHYRLKFLSWLPHRLRSPYLRWSGKGSIYDCEPLNLKEVETMLSGAKLSYENISLKAAKVTFELERPDSLTLKILQTLPDRLLLVLGRLIPTLIFKIRKIDASRQTNNA